MEQKHIPVALVIIISLGFFGTLAILAFHSVPAENKDALVAMLGVLGAAFGALVGYYFGSSVGKAVPVSTQPAPPENPQKTAGENP